MRSEKKRNFDRWLSERGIRLDQKLDHATRTTQTFSIRSRLSIIRSISEDGVVLQLLRLNAAVARHLEVDKVSQEDLQQALSLSGILNEQADPKTTAGSDALCHILQQCADRQNEPVVTTTRFLKEAGNYALQAEGSYVISDFFARVLGVSGTTGKEHHPALRNLLDRLSKLPVSEDDIQFALTTAGDQLVFRAITVLDDYHQRQDSGLVVPGRVLLAHAGRYGLFTSSQIEELEALINDPVAREGAFQEFFERYPHFFGRWDHREVHPQVYLTSQQDPSLVPDFILTDPEVQKATILDLKRPQPRLIVHQDNRVRFAAAIVEARAQLLNYRRFFEDARNRENMRTILGMEIYHPHLAVIIGRSSEFNTSLERQRLAADNPDVEVVTYDDIVAYAKRRRLLIES